MSTIYETFPTQRNFTVQPTGSGGSLQIEYQGNQGTIQALYQTVGTGTWTFQLPRPLQYSLQVGTQFTFQNLSTGLLTITADNGSTVGTVATGTQVITTMLDTGNTSSSWAIVSSPSTAYSGVLPIANGGTGYAYLQANPIPNAIPAYDANSALRAKTFVGSVVDETGSNVAYTNNTLPDTTMIKSGGGATSYTLPNETTAVLGTRARFINNSSSDNMTILTVFGGVNVIPPGYLADYEFIIDNTGGKAWVGYSRPITNISASVPLSLDATYTTGSIVNVPFAGWKYGAGDNSFGGPYYNYYDPGANGLVYDSTDINPNYYLKQPYPFNYQMTYTSTKTTVINNWYVSADPLQFTNPVVFLPDVSTIPVGSTYDFSIQNPGGGRVAIWTNKSNGVYDPIYIGAATNATCVCVSNDPSLQSSAWNIRTGSALPSQYSILLDYLTDFIQMVPYIQDIAGKGISAIENVFTDLSTVDKDLLMPLEAKLVGRQISNPIPVYSTSWPANTYTTEVKNLSHSNLNIDDPFGAHHVITPSVTGTTSAIYANTWATVPPYQILSYGIVTHIL